VAFSFGKPRCCPRDTLTRVTTTQVLQDSCRLKRTSEAWVPMAPDCPSFTLTPAIENLKVVERFFNVPLDHAQPDGPTIRVFARNLIPKDKAKTPEEEAKLPYRECRTIDALVRRQKLIPSSGISSRSVPHRLGRCSSHLLSRRPWLRSGYSRWIRSRC
jgi:hypothetical protein